MTDSGTGTVGAGARVVRAIVVMLAVATTTSWLQFFIVTVRRQVLGEFSWRWWFRDQLLLSASGYLILFLIVSFLPIVVHTLWPKRYSFAAVFATLAGLGSLFALLVIQSIHPLAWLAVAVGLAVQLHRMASRRPEATWRATRRMALMGNLASVITVAALTGVRANREREAMRGLAVAPAGARNVLLLILDTVRASSLSLYGAPYATTPALAARVRQGVVFDAAYSTAPWTLPSHASMFTGQYASLTSADWMTPLDGDTPTLAEAFRTAGYATGGFVANMNMTGAHTGLARGFMHYEDAPHTLVQMLYSTTVGQPGSVRNALNMWDETRWITGTMRAAVSPLQLRPMSDLPRNDVRFARDITHDFLTWLPSAEGRPFFAFLNLFDAHAPYHPPRQYRPMFDTTRAGHGRYLGAIRYMDDAIEELLQDLERRGMLENTLVVISSDHGELFGEHEKYGHGNALYRPLLHVPLVVLNAPNAARGARIQRPVSLRDLAATLLDLAAIPNQFPGHSLRPLLDGTDSLAAVSPVVSEVSRAIRDVGSNYLKEDLKALIDDTLKTIRGSSGSISMFAYPADTAESADVAVAPAVRAAGEERLRHVLDALGIKWRP
ncbi:MAG: sulfatase [Gemmatimonas sp.]